MNDCVFFHDDYYCVGCVPSGSDETPIPVQLFDAVSEYPKCVVCGKEHRYMLLETDEELAPIRVPVLSEDGVDPMEEQLRQLNATLDRMTHMMSRLVDIQLGILEHQATYRM